MLALITVGTTSKELKIKQKIQRRMQMISTDYS